jgi:hypothetical protein
MACPKHLGHWIAFAGGFSTRAGIKEILTRDGH